VRSRPAADGLRQTNSRQLLTGNEQREIARNGWFSCERRMGGAL
jgi:hypothetical protein